ncbi:hypothetical protein F2P81_008566 [Scophthalmus maximus]|uniref:Spt4/RpoE2 zinc finger domain-containing protein n=1 Tax=Scophthalmus maximus TaxID=52904 RepID=A0A6A4T795_SCOMX|nr:hypothetical protein F2P81_008566 [Scophthalmus maximus]
MLNSDPAHDVFPGRQRYIEEQQFCSFGFSVVVTVVDLMENICDQLCFLLSEVFIDHCSGLMTHYPLTQSPPRLPQTIDQFEYDGCDNCESYLQMKGNREMVYECTSSSFDG